MAGEFLGGARALLGQGLGMGWGDEGEAWLRSKLGEDDYEQNLKRIREEYAQFSKKHPFTAGASEFAGGAAPGIAAMFIPGMQPVGAAQIGATGMGALARMSALGGLSGAVSGAGSAGEDSRGSGAASGAVLGAGLGLALPVALRGAGAGARWLQERLMPTEALVGERAIGKMSKALESDEVTPQQMQNTMAQDKSMNVPSLLANASPGLSDLAETVAQRSGGGARQLETAIQAQKLGAKERTHQQVVKGLKPGDYYDDLQNLEQETRKLAGPAYEKAYAYGEVTDPKVLSFLDLPQFKQGLGEAQKLLAAEGRQLDMSKPTVEVLDQVKRGLDALIEKETDAITGKTSSLGRVYTKKKNEFLEALDTAVPDYELARGIYSGGAELKDAMRKGFNEFGSMDHEQVIKTVKNMPAAEKEAFRTGVARDLYGKIMNSSGNFNAAQRIIGSPEMQAKLQPLFDNPGQFNLFKAALERESQLFGQANKVLGGSQTGKRAQMREEFEGAPGAGEAIAGAVTGGFAGSLGGMVVRFLRTSQMPEATANKLAKMLTAKDPAEVAAVVKLLEEHAAASAPKAFKAGAREAGAITGATGAVWPSPSTEKEAETAKQPSASFDIEKDLDGKQEYDIEKDLEAP